MKRLLIVAPHFPPVDAVDSHRIRMNINYYKAGGWEPTVLTILESVAGRPVDERLLLSISAEIPVERTGAIPIEVAKFAGLSTLGLRSFYALAQAGDRLIAKGMRAGKPFNLAFFSTTAFPAMALAPRWLSKFDLPYILDIQDPWFTTPGESIAFRRMGLKHRLMRSLHRRLEAKTVPNVAGLISVSPRYIDALQAAYPTLRKRPAEVIPFGWSNADTILASEIGRPWPQIEVAKRNGGIAAISAGRAGKVFNSAIRTLFKFLHAAPRGSRLSKLRLLFLGTGYQQFSNRPEVKPIAEEEGINERVTERPDRIPLFDVIATLSTADVLLIFGSDDLAYQPSKLYQYLSLEKPILIVAPRSSRLAQQVKGLAGIVYVEALDMAPTPEEVVKLECELTAAMSLPRSAFERRRQMGAEFEAASLAKRECALFEKAQLMHLDLNSSASTMGSRE